MTNLIDVSYFVGDRSIPNKDNAEVKERITFFIKKYQADLFYRSLGMKLNNLLIAEDPIVADSRFDKLVNGTTYTSNHNGEVVWEGFKSLLVDYVYFYYMRDAATQSTGIGVVIKKAELAYNVSPANKLIDAWNCFSEKHLALTSFLLADSNLSIYPEYNTVDAIYSNWFAQPINEFDI